MSRSLSERIETSQELFSRLDAVVALHSGRLTPQVELSVKKILNFRVELEHVLKMLKAREVARLAMANLEMQADNDDRVMFAGTRTPFQFVRFLSAQAYLTTNWSVADRITALAGRILCSATAGRNEAKPAQLVSDFVNKDRNKNTTAPLSETIRVLFGWPIGLSYAIRNHFVHDVAHVDGIDVFAGPNAAAAFKISDEGWDRIELKACTYGVDSSLHRAGASWPISPKDDLRLILEACERESDDALGILIVTAFQKYSWLIGSLVGEA